MKKISFIIFLFVPLSISAQQKELPFTVKEAPEWTNLFKRDSGWFGGDGIFAIPLNGKENMEPTDTTDNLFIFSDTMFGRISDGVLQPGYKMVNNSIAILEGHDPDPARIKFRVLKDASGNPETIFTPKTPQTGKEDYLWMGDGFVNPADKAMYFFAYRIVNIPGVKDFGFKLTGNILIKIPHGSRYPFTDQEQYDIPLIPEKAGGGTFGAAVFVNTKEANAPQPDGYIYIYGITDARKSLVAARVIPNDFGNYARWKFWDGKDWTAQIENIFPIVDGVSNETSISPVPGGKYALVFHTGLMSHKIAMCTGVTPIGPFSEPVTLFDCSADMEAPSFYSYNAKAHPSLSMPGELLVSYNVNSFDFDNMILKYPQLYRPRFFRVIFK